MRCSLLVALVLIVSGCGSSTTDKAGNVGGTTTVLTLANSLGDTNELQAFADEVAKRSDGAIRIRFVNEWRLGEPNYEPGLIKDVAAGKADLGWVGSRAWDALGIRDFDALTAPFVIDSYALERDVLQSDIPDGMLRSIESLGVVGLGVLPGPLRYVLAAPRSLLAPDDYVGLRVGYQRGPARDTLLALGAKPVVIPSAAPWRGIDAIEQQIASINANGYDQFAKHLTANVALWPRPFVIFAGRKTMARLSETQRSLLRDAMRASVPDALEITLTQERRAMASLCRRGIEAAQAGDADVAAWRDAVAPVLARLQHDAGTRSALGAIAAMRAQTDPEPALICAQEKRPSSAALPDGTYKSGITRADIIANGVDHELNEAEIDDFDRSKLELTLDGGNFILRKHHPGGRVEIDFAGEFSVYRDRFVATGDNRDVVLRARFSFDGTSLRFHDVSPHGYYSATWGSQPWTRERQP
jgi:TRAP-type C4-dicarboxylate transport system substrate-binding protein